MPCFRDSWSTITAMALTRDETSSTYTDPDNYSDTVATVSCTFTRVTPNFAQIQSANCFFRSYPIYERIIQQIEVGSWGVGTIPTPYFFPIRDDTDDPAEMQFGLSPGEFMIFVEVCMPFNHIVVYKEFSDIGDITTTGKSAGVPFTYSSTWPQVELPKFYSPVMRGNINNTDDAFDYLPLWFEMDGWTIDYYGATPYDPTVYDADFTITDEAVGGVGVNAEQSFTFLTSGKAPLGRCLIHATALGSSLHWRYISSGKFGTRPTLEFIGYGDSTGVSDGQTIYSMDPPVVDGEILFSENSVQITEFGNYGFRFGFIGKLGQQSIDAMTWEIDPNLGEEWKFSVAHSFINLPAGDAPYSFIGCGYASKYVTDGGVVFDYEIETAPADGRAADYTCSIDDGDGRVMTLTCT